MDREDIIENNENWFKFFVYLPLILAGITMFSFFVWGIVDPAVFKVKIYFGDYWDSTSVTTYGIMRFDTFFGAMIVWWLIGAISSVITYVVAKLSLSYKVLHIYQLQELRETNQEILKKMKYIEKQSEEEGSKKALD